MRHLVGKSWNSDRSRDMALTDKFKRSLEINGNTRDMVQFSLQRIYNTLLHFQLPHVSTSQTSEAKVQDQQIKTQFFNHDSVNHMSPTNRHTANPEYRVGSINMTLHA